MGCRCTTRCLISRLPKKPFLGDGAFHQGALATSAEPKPKLPQIGAALSLPLQIFTNGPSQGRKTPWRRHPTDRGLLFSPCTEVEATTTRPHPAVGGLRVVSIAEHLKSGSFFFPPTRTRLSLSSTNTSCGYIFLYYFFALVSGKKSFLRDIDQKKKKNHAAPPSPCRTQNTRIITNTGPWAPNPDPALSY